jgi:deoxyribose-phosphate aldolase
LANQPVRLELKKAKIWLLLKIHQEAIDENFKLIMIRLWYGFMARKMIADANSNVEIGTVIDFPEVRLEAKLNEGIQAIQDGADDLILYVIMKRLKGR